MTQFYFAATRDLSQYVLRNLPGVLEGWDFSTGAANNIAYAISKAIEWVDFFVGKK